VPSPMQRGTMHTGFLVYGARVFRVMVLMSPFKPPSSNPWMCLLLCGMALCILDSWLMAPEFLSSIAYITLQT
jgi:hypothetical protein